MNSVGVQNQEGGLDLRKENLDHIYENIVNIEEKVEDTTWGADVDRFMGDG